MGYRGSERPATHTQQNLTKVPPPPPGGGVKAVTSLTLTRVTCTMNYEILFLDRNEVQQYPSAHAHLLFL